jgi:outer membrane protein
MSFATFLHTVRSLVLPLTVTLCGAGIAGAQQQGTPPVYTLEQCLRIANERNIDIRVADASTQAAAAGLTAAFGNYLPGATINANYNRQLTNLRPQLQFINGIPVPGEPLPNNYSLQAAVRWTLFDGFRREGTYDQAKTTVDAADLNGRAQRMQTSMDVRRQFIAVLRAMQVVKTRSENIELGRQTLERVRAGQAAGRQPITAVYSQEADLGAQEFELVRAENDLDLAKAQLLAIMGLDPNTPAEFTESSLPASITPEEIRAYRDSLGSEDACVTRALTSRPDIVAAEQRIRAAEAGVTIARSGYFPTVTASTGYTWNNSEISNFDNQGQMSVGVNLSVPVFDQFRTNQQIESAVLQQVQRRAERQRLEQQVRQSVQSALLSLAAAEKQLDITGRALTSAELNDAAARDRYAAGAATQFDVLQANTQMITSRINRITALYTYYDARVMAEFAAGTLD